MIKTACCSKCGKEVMDFVILGRLHVGGHWMGFSGLRKHSRSVNIVLLKTLILPNYSVTQISFKLR